MSEVKETHQRIVLSARLTQFLHDLNGDIKEPDGTCAMCECLINKQGHHKDCAFQSIVVACLDGLESVGVDGMAFDWIANSLSNA